MTVACRGGSPSSSSASSPSSSSSSPAAALSHEAYVWQRAWTGAVRAAVANAQPELSGLRVLTLEIAPDGTARSPAIDTASLVRASRPITAVVRIDGSRVPAETSLAPAFERIERWRAAGVPVAGLEIDHDCATAALGDYATWLAAHRPAALRFSITALPTWASAPDELRAIAAAVDEMVVQVHAVRAPAIFDAAAARRWLEQFAAVVAVRRPVLRVALPTYEVALGAAEPEDVGAFLRALEREPVPGVAGVVWFRLPVPPDRTAWSAAVLGAVIRGAPQPLEEIAHAR
ncbi:MAG TPA: DUF3142 domain-containing protein [Kofleriaceae bacterium]|nr:DUF3142 domain-containing protein [Kofleriaceae bacterium]